MRECWIVACATCHFSFFNGQLSCNFLVSLYILQIGETIADKAHGKPLPTIKVEEPTVKMSFSVNTSPFSGREVGLIMADMTIISILRGRL